jgi:membrane protease YdiL (CAAX protease family)
MAVEILFLLPGLFLLVLANYTEKKKDLRIITQVFLSLVVILFILLGAMTLAMDNPEITKTIKNPAAYGYGIILSGIIALLLFLKPLRAKLAKVIGIEADNWLHVTALVFAVLLTGMTVATMASTDLKSLTGGVKLSTDSVILQDVFFVAVSLFGVGWLVRRKLKETLQRLGVVKPSLKDLALSGVFVAVIFAVMIVIGLVALLLGFESDALETKGDPTIQLLGEITILTAIIFSLGAGIGEEILFRGAMQPRMGLVLTSIVFALTHIQYPQPVNMAAIFSISIIIGYERKIANTTACMITHTVYDLILFLAIALA